MIGLDLIIIRTLFFDLISEILRGRTNANDGICWYDQIIDRISE
jgi:hypothetical protein